MDSPPEAVKTTTALAAALATTITTATSDSPPVQESPFSNYVSNLSPIKPVKTSHAVQGFLGINSPPLVFTTPRLIPHRETNFLKRSHCPQLSRLEVAENDDQSKIFATASCNMENSTTSPGSQWLPDTQNHDDGKNPGQDQPSSPSGCVDEYLSDPIEVDCSNSMNLANPEERQTGHVLQLSLINCINSKEATSTTDEIMDAATYVEPTQRLYGQAEEEPQQQSMLEIVPVKGEEEQNGGEQPSNECTNAETDSLITQKHEDSDKNLTVILTGSVQNVMQHDPEASHLQRGMSRRCLQFGETLSPPYVVKSPSKPPGIGLHLNSIANALPLGHRATATIKATPGSSCQLVDKKISSSNWSGMVESVPIISEDTMQETEALLAASEPFHKIESLNVSQPLEVTPQNERKLNSEFDSFEEFNQSNPKKKRKKASTIDGDGCKRCNCKKSKCLKLYCDCFAAGIYCAEPCSCQGCFNRSEYKETVLETRQQIESRNPLAFAPKIVQNITEFPTAIVDDKGMLATSSARHKRGCNCKKSLCLKKYCECYQSNVGCSNECRCDGCKNVYGRKEEYGLTEEILSQRATDETLESTSDNKLEMVATNEGLLQVQHNITPLTPSFQFSDHRKDATISRLGRYVASPESDLSILPSYTKRSRYHSDTRSNNIIQERNKEVGLCSSDQMVDYNYQMTNQFSPRCDEVAGVCDLSPLQNPSLSSASSKTRNWIQLCPGSGRLLPTGSLCWRSSPITPMAQLGETKNQVLDSCSGLHNVVDDDTPDILKEESTPTISVKVSSPNKKRVSPPHGRTCELVSSSSGFKSGRKFILRAVPSFPPLTPCIDSKDSTNQKHQ